jgi:hypothetical protein
MIAPMKRILLLLMVGSFAGCEDETVKRVAVLADEACGCGEPACADAVEAKYVELVKEGQKRGSADDRKEIEKSYARMRDCIAKARTADPEGQAGNEAGSPSPIPAP